MFKNILYLIAGAVIATLVIGVAGFAYAQTQTPPADSQTWFGRGGGMMGSGYRGGMMGRGNGNGGYGLMHPYMVQAFAEKLGLSADELQSELTAGKTMWQVAQEQGLSDDEIRTTMQEAAKQAITKMVADGVITQQQADWMLQRMGGMLQNGFGFGSGPCHGGNWGGPGSRWAPTPTPSAGS
jgi:hypothetical protein